MGLITLTTDFGLADGYVGAMKGVILGIEPSSTIVDISHEVAPQDILGGSFVLASVHRYFPEGTVHVAVVDPGVGTARRAIAVASPRATFMAPDNGLLSLVLADYGCRATAEGASPASTGPRDRPFPLRMANLPVDLRAVALTNSRYWLPERSTTFHGRDIFAPVGAHLAKGIALADLGKPISSVALYVLPQPQLQTDGSLAATVLHVDHFGNAITNATREDIPFPSFVVEAAGRTLSLRSAYAEAPGLFVLFGSTGRLELAKRNANAALALGLKVGDTVIVRAR